MPLPRVWMKNRGRLALPEAVVGVVLNFGRWFGPELFGGCGAGQRVLVAPYALDGYLRRLRQGRADLELCLDHNGDQVLATAEDDCLSLEPSSDGSALLLKLRTDTAAGRRAYRAILRSECFDLSATLTGVEAYSMAPNCLVVVEASIPEIGAVQHGACEGCHWEF
jgi:hypothetical protein